MNRILFEPAEIASDQTVTFGGDRAAHVLDVLHGSVGQTLKTGVLDGPIGSSEIIGIGTRGTGTGANGSGIGSHVVDAGGENSGIGSHVVDAGGEVSGIGSHVVDAGGEDSGIGERTVTVRCSHTEKSPEPWIDLLLAPPRPRALKRLLPQLAALGVGKIVLVGAEKVEKDFWGAQILKERVFRPLLVEGLQQAGTSRVPQIVVRKRFREYLARSFETDFPTTCRIVAHPYGAGQLVPEFANCGEGKVAPEFANCGEGKVVPEFANCGKILLAIGPEGGWTEEEVAVLEARGFCRYSLGSRILRTDTATIALIAQLALRRDVMEL